MKYLRINKLAINFAIKPFLFLQDTQRLFTFYPKYEWIQYR